MDAKDISIKKDGKWYFGTAEMFRREILNVLARNLNKDEAGNYYIQMGEEIAPITVEDVPFLATGYLEEEGKIKLVFHDLQEMEISRESKLFLKGDIPYVSFRWEADTRLSRGVYWKLSDYFDFREDEVYIVPPQTEEG